MTTQFRPEQMNLTKYWDFGSGTMRVPAGTSFPAGPGDGDTYYRTDEDLLYIYDGAGWARIQNQAVDVAIEQVGSPTYEDVQDWINTTQSAGLISGGVGTATSYAIATADDVAETFTITGDVAAYFTNGVVFTVSGSTGNDGDYTTVGNSTFGGGVTTITVADVPDGTDDGDIADGRVDVALGAGIVKKTDDAIDGVTAFFDWPATPNILLVDNKVNWVYATYGAGTPAVATTDDHTAIDFTTEFVIFVVYREGTVLHIMQAGLYIFDAFRSMARRVRELRRIERASGAIISNEGTLKIKVTAAVLYSVMTRITTSEVDTSGAGRFRAWYHDGGGNWTSTGYPADQTDIDSANYDTGTGLAALAAARYGVYWVFLDFDSHLHIVYGVTSYKLHEAQAAEMPAIPDICSEFSVLVARVIAFKDAAEITEVASAFVTTFLVATAASHADLADLEIITGGHTLTGAKWDLVGATALNTLGLLTPSDDVSAGAEAILKSTAAGDLALHDLSLTNDLLLADGAVIGITGNETIQFNVAGTIQILGADLVLEDGQALLWSDVNLYRNAANVLRTEDALIVGGLLTPSAGISTPGNILMANLSYIGRDAAERIQFNADDTIQILDADVLLGDEDGGGRLNFVEDTTIAEGIVWGLDANKVTLYRSADDMLKTDDSLTVALGLNIGTATGAVPGDVWGASATSWKPRWEIKNTNANNSSGYLAFYKDGGSPADDDYIGIIYFYGKNSVDAETTYAGILVQSTDVTNGTEDGKLSIFTQADSAFVETAWFEDSKVYNVANSADWDVVSDEVLKHHIIPISQALGSLCLLEPITFQFNEEYGQINPASDLTRNHVGFTAQNFARVFPEQVSTLGKYKTMNTGGLDALIVAGIQELDGYRLSADAEREAIRMEIASAKEQIGILQNQLALLNRAA